MIQGSGASGQSLDQQRDGGLFLWTKAFGRLQDQHECAVPRASRLVEQQLVRGDGQGDGQRPEGAETRLCAPRFVAPELGHVNGCQIGESLLGEAADAAGRHEALGELHAGTLAKGDFTRVS